MDLYGVFVGDQFLGLPVEVYKKERDAILKARRLNGKVITYNEWKMNSKVKKQSYLKRINVNQILTKLRKNILKKDIN
jgi:hypothetical protein